MRITDPYAPHVVPSSPHSVQSSNQDGDSEPIFGFCDAEVETRSVAGGVHGRRDVEASRRRLCQRLRQCLALSEDPSINFCDRTGSSLDSQLRSNEDLKQPEEIAHCKSAWASFVVESLDTIQKSNFMRRKVIRYGDDCSGARGPFDALCKCSMNLCMNSMEVHVEGVLAS